MWFFLAISIGAIEVNPTSDLEQVRLIVNKFLEDCKEVPKVTDWCFLDCKYSTYTVSRS